MEVYFIDDPAYDGTYILYASEKKIPAGTTVRAYVNNIFHEISPHNDHFFLIPVEYQENNIQVSVISRDINWSAKAIGFFKKCLGSQTCYVSIASPNQNFFEDSFGFEKLEYNHSFSTSFNLMYMNLQIKRDQLLFSSHLSQGFGMYKVSRHTKNYYFNICRFGRKSFDYKIGDWFVCYKLPGHKVSYRIGKDIHINCSTFMNKFDKYHYLTLDKKTIPIGNVFFQSKIQSIDHFFILMQTMYNIGLNHMLLIQTSLNK